MCRTTHPQTSMRVTKKYEHLVHLGFMEALALCAIGNKSDENKFNKSNEGSQEHSNSTQTTLVAVEVKPQFLESQLPPSVRQKKFGAM